MSQWKMDTCSRAILCHGPGSPGPVDPEQTASLHTYLMCLLPFAGLRNVGFCLNLIGTWKIKKYYLSTASVRSDHWELTEAKGALIVTGTTEVIIGS